MSSRQGHPVALLIDELVRFTPRFSAIFADAAASVDLSRMELMVLSATVEASTPPTVPQIGRSLGHPRQVIQRSANQLIERGLITAAANPDHKRAPLLLATTEGRKAKAAVDALLEVKLDALRDLLGAEPCACLTGQLHDARRKVEAHLRGKGI